MCGGVWTCISRRSHRDARRQRELCGRQQFCPFLRSNHLGKARSIAVHRKCVAPRGVPLAHYYASRVVLVHSTSKLLRRRSRFLARNVALPDGNDRFASTAVVTRLRAFETQVIRATD